MVSVPVNNIWLDLSKNSQILNLINFVIKALTLHTYMYMYIVHLKSYSSENLKK